MPACPAAFVSDMVAEVLGSVLTLTGDVVWTRAPIVNLLETVVDVVSDTVVAGAVSVPVPAIA